MAVPETVGMFGEESVVLAGTGGLGDGRVRANPALAAYLGAAIVSWDRRWEGGLSGMPDRLAARGYRAAMES